MTARASCCPPSGPHILPEVRIIAGIEASIMTSEGTCRLVIPRSESTIAISGPWASAASKAARISAPFSRFSRPAKIPPSPSLADSPAAASSSPYLANTSAKNALTVWPKMIGSETFIIVAFRCTEKRMPSSFARATCALRNSCSAAASIFVASTISPSSTGIASRSTVISLPACSSTRRVSSPSIITDCSFEAKSLAPIVATFVLESFDHSPIECGWERVVLHRRRRAAIGGPLAQDGVDRRALHPVVGGAGSPLLLGGGLIDVVGNIETGGLQLLHRGLELRHRSGDVRQFDDVSFGGFREFTESGKRVVHGALAQALGELGEDPPSTGNVTGFDVHPGAGLVGLGYG